MGHSSVDGITVERLGSAGWKGSHSLGRLSVRIIGNERVRWRRASSIPAVVLCADFVLVRLEHWQRLLEPGDSALRAGYDRECDADRHRRVRQLRAAGRRRDLWRGAGRPDRSAADVDDGRLPQLHRYGVDPAVLYGRPAQLPGPAGAGRVRRVSRQSRAGGPHVDASGARGWGGILTRARAIAEHVRLFPFASDWSGAGWTGRGRVQSDDGDLGQ